MALGGACLALSLPACERPVAVANAPSELREAAATALSKATTSDPSMTARLRDAAAYAVFPTVGKAAVGIGGAYGKGVLYERGAVTGTCELTQASIGAQFGGQTSTEFVAFATPEAVDSFKAGSFAIHAQATTAAVTSDAGASAVYSDGVLTFIMDEAGLLFEASIAGQKFSLKPE